MFSICAIQFLRYSTCFPSKTIWISQSVRAPQIISVSSLPLASIDNFHQSGQRPTSTVTVFQLLFGPPNASLGCADDMGIVFMSWRVDPSCPIYIDRTHSTIFGPSQQSLSRAPHTGPRVERVVPARLVPITAANINRLSGSIRMPWLSAMKPYPQCIKPQIRSRAILPHMWAMCTPIPF